MAVAADYSGWVRELDEYQSNNDGQYDERLEATADNGKTSRAALGSRSGGVNTSRKMKPRGTSAASTAPVSQAEELQQEMKLLNWHKLANEAALKAAIIKTNKIKQEDTQFASALTQGEREERAQRAQQIIEEEQLKPLQVNSEFFRNMEAKGQRDEAKLDDDVQRHIQHLRRLKESMAQREDMQRRRQQYREKMMELQASGNGTSRFKMLTQGSNQDEAAAASPGKHDRGNSNSIYHRAAMAAGGKAAQDNANVVTSLDKLMELEQRIRHLEDAGLAVDDLDDARDGNTSSRTAGSKEPNAAGGLRFAKRRTNGGLHEPSKTVYAVTGATKMRARDKTTVSTRRAQASTTAANAKKRALNNNNAGARNRTKSRNDTSLTSLPESKQRQLRRMTDRERRNFLKNEKAKEVREQSRKQDVVIEGWLEKKRAAANQRKASTSQVRAGAATAKSSSTVSARNPKQRLPPPPRVRAPAVGAASGKRIANSHLQKLDDIKKGFAKRKEAFQRLPPTTSKPSGRFNSTNTATANRNQRSFTRSAVIGANTRQTTVSQRFGSTSLPPARSAASNRATSSRQVPTRQAPNQRATLAQGPAAGHVTSKLPVIQRNAAPPSSITGSRRPGPPGLVVVPSTTLPRLSASRISAMPSPPAVRNANMPTFSRLHRS
ncbi:unnamed protein product [Phytophthora lilii]|uniref:Unnamed protein product n=1 Tax=Phytophthora lilii TaxID=2077276 RepID=A0A9W6XIC4_9STRA|nr:unnamed protein product [Phytophthora lilii]